MESHAQPHKHVLILHLGYIKVIWGMLILPLLLLFVSLTLQPEWLFALGFSCFVFTGFICTETFYVLRGQLGVIQQLLQDTMCCFFLPGLQMS